MYFFGRTVKLGDWRGPSLFAQPDTLILLMYRR